MLASDNHRAPGRIQTNQAEHLLGNLLLFLRSQLERLRRVRLLRVLILGFGTRIEGFLNLLLQLVHLH